MGTGYKIALLWLVSQRETSSLRRSMRQFEITTEQKLCHLRQMVSKQQKDSALARTIRFCVSILCLHFFLTR